MHGVLYSKSVLYKKKVNVLHTSKAHQKNNLPVKPTITNVGSMDKITDLGDIFLNCIYIILSAVKEAQRCAEKWNQITFIRIMWKKINTCCGKINC